MATSTNRMKRQLELDAARQTHEEAIRVSIEEVNKRTLILHRFPYFMVVIEIQILVTQSQWIFDCDAIIQWSIFLYSGQIVQFWRFFGAFFGSAFYTAISHFIHYF